MHLQHNLHSAIALQRNHTRNSEKYHLRCIYCYYLIELYVPIKVQHFTMHYRVSFIENPRETLHILHTPKLVCLYNVCAHTVFRCFTMFADLNGTCKSIDISYYIFVEISHANMQSRNNLSNKPVLNRFSFVIKKTNSRNTTHLLIKLSFEFTTTALAKAVINLICYFIDFFLSAIQSNAL